jgi:Gas vesicle protein
MAEPTPTRRGILGGDRGGTSLVELLDRVVHRGAYVSGDVVICLAGIDLVRLDLRLLLTAVQPTDHGPEWSR